MSGRRGFIKGVGLFGALFAGGAGVRAATTEPVIEHNDVASAESSVTEPVEDISHLAPPDKAFTLQINGQYGEDNKPQPAYPGSNLYFQPMNPVVTHSVALAVGKDDRLWMRIGDEWRRVAIE